MLLTIAIALIVSALLLYTIAIWSEKIIKKLKPWMVIIFSMAFTCDLISTSLMFFIAIEKFSFNIHSACGYLALTIMGLHLAWAFVSLRQRSKAEKYFHKFSIFAWFAWLLAFISGVPRG